MNLNRKEITLVMPVNGKSMSQVHALFKKNTSLPLEMQNVQFFLDKAIVSLMSSSNLKQ